ncbi:hypothetical protein [Halorientalis sp.]|uniref:hypothetical protein n=1 Tax=Halorientalis sp. TaxID=1931229 RepID=UPI002622DAD6|nr:hypothetical protein [Halorientalis sp.]
MGPADQPTADEPPAAVLADATTRLTELLNRYDYDALVRRLYWLSRAGTVAVLAAVFVYPVQGELSSWIVGVTHLAGTAAVGAAFAVERTLAGLEDDRSADETTARRLWNDEYTRLGVYLLATLERRHETGLGRFAIWVLFGTPDAGYGAAGGGRRDDGSLGSRSTAAGLVGVVVTEQFLYTADAQVFATRLEGWLLVGLTLAGGLIGALLVR